MINMKLSIIVPVYNEEATIKVVLSKLLKQKLPCSTEIIVVDDGSFDKTVKEIKNLKSQFRNLKLLLHRYNQGKGEAIKTGIKASHGDYILIQDADLEYNPEEIPKLIAPLLKTKSMKGQIKTLKAIYGSRFKYKQVKISLPYYLGNMFLTFLTNVLFGTNLTDMETGYKLLPTEFMKSIKLKASRFDIEPEITAKLIKAGFSITEVPISYMGRSHLAGKKLTITDAFAAIKTLVSHKFIP